MVIETIVDSFSKDFSYFSHPFTISKKIITAYKAEDFATVFGFLSITIIYTTLIALLGGGGR